MADPESSVQSVISNDDLLKEILVRLPVLSLFLFKSVSKRWLSLIKGAKVTFRRKLDPISGLILKKCSRIYDISYEFVPLDIRIPICRSSLLTAFQSHRVEILDSCNGLLVCCTKSPHYKLITSQNFTYSEKLYVYNPSITNMFKLLPEPENVTFYDSFIAGGLKMAFDPTKSPHYKLIYAEKVDDDGFCVRIHTYSSETGSWSLCGHLFPEDSFICFKYGVYWNDAIYWINCGRNIFKLDIMNDHPVLTDLQTPGTLHRKVNYACRLFESRGCLLLVVQNVDHFGCFSIFEKGNVYSEWSVKCFVNLNGESVDVYRHSESWTIYKNIFCIVLGEREEDSFLVMELDKKVVQYKFMSKTLSTISDLGPNEDLVEGFQFIPSFATV